MNGRVMWFYWAAFCDACLRLAPSPAGIPAEFWVGLGRGVLLGLLNDGLVRGRSRSPGSRRPRRAAPDPLVRPPTGRHPLPAELARRYKREQAVSRTWCRVPRTTG